ESSSMALLLSLYLGDATQVSAALATLPTLYAQAGYSRAHESEADGFALAFLEDAGIDPGSFATIMEKLDAAAGVELPEAVQYLSSHPPTEDRIDRLRARAFAARASPLPCPPRRCTSRGDLEDDLEERRHVVTDPEKLGQMMQQAQQMQQR